MKTILNPLSFLVLALALMLSACGSISAPDATEAAPTEVPVVISDIAIVSEGRVVPGEEVQLSFFTNGQVDEVLVEEGDTVQKGDIVARLGNREQIEAQIAAAESELVAANQALKDLNDAVTTARTNALQAVTAANRAVRDAQYQVDVFTIPTSQQGMTAMEAVVATREALDEARTAFEPYKYFSSNNSTRKDLKEKLDEAQAEYNAAIRRLEYETALKNAQADLDQALEDYAIYENGPDPDDVEAAEARIVAAEANLAAAEAALDNLELEATISGTIVNQDLIVGQQVTAGQPVMRIADFSQMYVETDDLTEIEVVDVEVGQPVTIVADALPDVEFTGVVESIGQVFEEKRGDITYTVKIRLDNPDPRLRWGMTVEVTFEE